MKPNTRHQSAVIRASVEEAQQKKARGQQTSSPRRTWNPRRGKGKVTPSASWWLDCPPDRFYAEAKRRSDLRERESPQGYRAPDEMGVA